MANGTITEEWRLVKDWPDYEVSSLGRVRRTCDGGRYGRGYILGPRLACGYPTMLAPNGRYANGRRRFKNLRVHILVCEAFHGPKPGPEYEVAHWDGNTRNPCASNLRWATRLENMQDRIRHGHTDRGEKHRDNKLTPDDVREIRRLMAGGAPLRATARRYGVTYQALQEIRTGRCWGWLE